MDLLSKLLRKMRDQGASDLLLIAGSPPAFRVHGQLQPRTENKSLSGQQIDAMLNLVLLSDQMNEFKQENEVNIGISLPDLGRFRVNAYRQRKETSLAIRAIPNVIPDFESLRLPSELKDIALQKSGLIIITGAAGSGKSTTLASMIDYRSKHDLGHIITVEDPIEYDIPHQQSVVSQREIGIDTDSYQKAFRSVLRQSPDVLMVGEVRDKDTVQRVMEFADTGHLCLTTLHANSSTQTFERIINMFQDDERDHILNTLANTFKAVLSQRLIPDAAGKLVLAYELLLPTSRTVDLIRRGEFWDLRESLEKSTSSGMKSIDQTLFELVKENRISEDTAVNNASSVNNLRLRMKLDNKATTTPDNTTH